MTHEQYLDEAGDAVQWMLRIDAVVGEIQAAKRKATEG